MHTPTAVLAGALVAVVSTASGAAFARRPAPPPCSVAVVDLNRAYTEHGRARKLSENLQAQEDAIKARLQAEEAKLKREVQDLEVRHAPGSEEYEKGRRVIELKIAEVSYDAKRDQFRARHALVQAMAAVYREIVTEAERIASERGYTCVVNYDPEAIVVEEAGQILSPDALRRRMIDRNTLWASSGVDLTKDVLEALAK